MYEGSFWSLYEPAIPTVFGALRAYRDAITAGPATGRFSRPRTRRPVASKSTGRAMTAKKRMAVILRKRSISGAVIVADIMQEDRRREDEAVEPVENAAMAGQDRAGILDAEVALDRRHRDVADEA